MTQAHARSASGGGRPQDERDCGFNIRLLPRFLHPLNAGCRAPSCVLPVAPANNARSIRTLGRRLERVSVLCQTTLHRPRSSYVVFINSLLKIGVPIYALQTNELSEVGNIGVGGPDDFAERLWGRDEQFQFPH